MKELSFKSGVEGKSSVLKILPISYVRAQLNNIKTFEPFLRVLVPNASQCYYYVFKFIVKSQKHLKCEARAQLSSQTINLMIIVN